MPGLIPGTAAVSLPHGPPAPLMGSSAQHLPRLAPVVDVVDQLPATPRVARAPAAPLLRIREHASAPWPAGRRSHAAARPGPNPLALAVRGSSDLQGRRAGGEGY